MKHVSLLVPHNAVLASIVDPRTMLSGVNDFLQAVGREPMFDIQLVGLTKEVRLHNGVFIVNTDVLVQDLKKTDLVLVPAIGGDLKEAIKLNEGFLPWIIEQYNQGAEV